VLNKWTFRTTIKKSRTQAEMRKLRQNNFNTMSDLKAKLASDPMPGRVVHVTVPVSLAYNLDKMQAVTKTVLGKLGHVGCHSGFDLRFIHENDFKFNEKGELFQH